MIYSSGAQGRKMVLEIDEHVAPGSSARADGCL